MTLKSRIKGAAIGAFVGGPGRALRRAVADVKRVVGRQTRGVDFYHDATDPWSYLTAQVVERLAARYPVEWRFHAISPPASDVDAFPKERMAHAVRDARDLSIYWDVEFPATGRALDPINARWISSVLIRERPFIEQVRAAIELGEAGWRNDTAMLQTRAGAWGHESHLAVLPVINEAYTQLRDAGHYQGAMLSYGGEWYWGIDRIPHLEARLAEDTGVELGTGVLQRRPEASRPPERLIAGDGPVPVELWLSFRSPYSYLALARVAELADRFPIALALRPVLPMVERGVPAPSIKRLYIVQDAQREADRLGIPFGQIADPLGKGVEHCLAIAKLAIDRGKGLDFARSAMQGIWSEARDVAEYVDLRAVVERAGLDWEVARASLAPEAEGAWKAWVAGNAEDLTTIGLWGVPSFRAGEYVAWGQDRIDLLADRLRRHVAARAAG